ncbi:MAG: FHA domain-containing protein [Holophagales bacterium]|nr:FHA domain-containing protein [Holophagales bacterium]
MTHDQAGGPPGPSPDPEAPSPASGAGSSGATETGAAADDAYATRHRGGLANAARSISPKSATTLFQPGAMAEAFADTGEESTSEQTRVLEGEPKAAERSLTHAAYFLRVGAEAGSEHIPVRLSRTIFGRDAGDVRLGDPTVSSRHFQVDIVGNELFVRDLGSRNGTHLNGQPVRYSELLPGDEVRAVETVLVFRREGDARSGRDS